MGDQEYKPNAKRLLCRIFDGSVWITLRKHKINLSRDSEEENWYITVTDPSGSYGYDGWWTDSEYESAWAALQEARRGAILDGLISERSAGE